MPGDRSHKVSDHGALPASGALSEEQFGQLLALLDDQHQALVALLVPIREVAEMILKDREAIDATKQIGASGPDNDGPGSGGSES